MIIAISGASGFIGKQITIYFHSKRNEIWHIPRILSATPVEELAKFLSGSDVIINLAGAPIIHRWTKTYKKIIFDSRIITTSKIVEAISLLETKPQLLISASAVGIYTQEGLHTENDFSKADDYLGQVCTAWELEAKKAIPYTRLAIIRLGIVLGKNGGALKRMIPLFRLGIGGKIASGSQGFPWIHIYDVVQALQFIIENQKLSGEFNFTSPKIFDNKKFTKELAKVLKKPAFLTVPSFALKLMYGEGASAVTGGQYAQPKHLIDAGYCFSYPDLRDALQDITS